MVDTVVDAVPVSGTNRDPVRQFVVRGSRFEVASKYTLIKAVGKGAYGVVCSCRDTETGLKVAVKKVEDAIVDPVDAKRTLREIKLLRFLNHENIIALVDVQPPSDSSAFDDVYQITELMDTDLHQIIRSKQPLSEDHFQYFMYQLFCALKYIHSAGVWHRDLKPGNLLVNRDCDLKLCDFGLARFVSTREVEAQQQMTEYVVTRWYRAPELILTRSYTESIDIWAAGCILAEMLGRKPIFPGKDYMDQISKIIGVVGTPSKADMSHISGKRAKAYIAGLGEMATVPWSTLYPKASETALDLLDKCLTFSPSRRITAEEALAHPFFEKYHEEEDEPSCSEQFEFGFEFEGVENMPLEEWRELIWREACHFHPECCPSS